MTTKQKKVTDSNEQKAHEYTKQKTRDEQAEMNK